MPICIPQSRTCVKGIIPKIFGLRFMHVEPIGGRARFANVSHLRDHRAFNCDVEIRILEDNDWRVATKLHRGLQNLVGSRS